MPGTGLPSGPWASMKPKVKPCCPSAETPARFGIHRTWVFRLSGFARSASIAAAFPCTSLPGTGIATSSANIAERPGHEVRFGARVGECSVRGEELVGDRLWGAFLGSVQARRTEGR